MAGNSTIDGITAGAGSTSRALSLRSWLAVREDIASLVYFRVAFGAAMLWEVLKYFQHDWIRRYWREPPFQFTYAGFEWLQALPGSGMYWLWAAMGVLSICILLGLAYRASMALFCLAFTYCFLLEQTRYLNHFYLICLISFLLIFVPCHRRWSLDAWLRSGLRTDFVPRYGRCLLLAQISLVYCFAGLAKLNSDWLAGEPIRLGLARLNIAQLTGGTAERPLALAIAYAGLVYDLTIPALFLWHRTRWLALAASLAFHVANSFAFRIGIFPWFMLACSGLYFAPDWPRRLLERLRAPFGLRIDAPMGVTPPASLLALFGVFFALQAILPLRHFLYPGNADWTEEGHKFAWRMKLREKRADVQYFVTDPQTKEVRRLKPHDYLPLWQYRRMAIDPELILQHAHHIAATFTAKQRPVPEVRALAIASLNGRRPQQLVDPTVDLAQQRLSMRAAAWIVPLKHPLPAGHSDKTAYDPADGADAE